MHCDETRPILSREADPMTATATTAEQFPLPGSRLWSWLLDAVEAASRKLKARRPLTGDAKFLYYAAEEFAGAVLDASDVAELRACLYTLARDERLMELESAMLGKARTSHIRPDSDLFVR